MRLEPTELSTDFCVCHGIFAHLAPDGRAVIGFGSNWGWDFSDFVEEAFAAGLELQARFSSWELHAPNDDFFVGVFGRR